MMKDPILEALFDKIILELDWKRKIVLGERQVDKYINKLHLIDIKEFIIHIYTHNSPHLLLLLSFKFWKNLSYKDWTYILKEICNQKGDIYKFLPYIYNYLEIDLITPLLKDNGISEVTKIYVRKIFILPDNSEKIGLTHLRIGDIDEYFGEFGITLLNLKEIKQKLINEGAIEAIKDIQEI